MAADGAYFKDLIEEDISRPGCYQWFRAFSTGSDAGCVKHIREMADVDFQRYDIIHINLCGVNASLYPGIKELIKGSSTLLISNVDYATEWFQDGFQKPRDFYDALRLSDFIFCQDPSQYAFIKFLVKHHMGENKPIAFIPHPVDTRLKKYRIDYDYRIDLIGVMFHRYGGGELLLPSMVSWGLKYPTVLFGLVAGNIPVGLFHFTAPMMEWKKYIYVLAHCALAFDYVSRYHCMGRFPMECACLGIPTVTTNTIYMGQKLYPKLCHEPMDFDGLRSSLQKLIDDENFYHEVAEYAYEQVEEYNLENSKKRLLTAMEEAGLKVG